MNRDLLLKHFERISEATDAIPRLRRFILDLAVRGKLVEQDPSDEPAAELLKRIQTEKARQGVTQRRNDATKGKKKVDVRSDVAALRETCFEVPVGWEWVRIRQITSDRGQVVPNQDFTYIDVTAINKEAGCIGDAQIVSPADAPSRARKRVCTGDVLYSCVRPYLLNIAVIENDIEPAPIASTAFAILNGFGLVLARYQWIVLRSPFMVECVEAKMRGQAYPAINDSDFAVLPFPLPPLAEQHRIVAKVDELMVLCDQLQAERNKREAQRDRLVASSLNRISTTTAEETKDAIRFHLNHLPRLTTRTEHIKQLRQTILSLAVRGRLVPQDPNDEPVTELLKRIQVDKARLVKEGKIKLEKQLDPINYLTVPFEAPAGWVWRKIDSIVCSLRNDIRTGPFGSTLHKDEHRESGVPVWGIESINKNGSFNGKCKIFVDAKKARELSSFAVTGGDIIISRSGTVGELCRLPDDAPFGLLSTNLMKITLNKAVITPAYFCLLFKGAESIDTQLSELCFGSTRLFLTQSILTKLFFPLPPLAEQHRIVAKVDELMALCGHLEANLNTTEADNRRLLEAVLRDALNPVIATKTRNLLV